MQATREASNLPNNEHLHDDDVLGVLGGGNDDAALARINVLMSDPAGRDILARKLRRLAYARLEPASAGATVMCDTADEP